MGQSTTVNQNKNIPDIVKNWISFYPLKSKFKVDAFFVVVVIGLLLYGLLMVFSASWSYSLFDRDPAISQLLIQFKWVVLGLLVAFVVSRFDYHAYKRWGLVFMLVSLALLTVVLVFGEYRFGSKRTLFSGSVQPSELAKLITIIYLAVWLNSKGNDLNNVKVGLIPMVFILGLNGGLIFLEPDLSGVITILVLGGLLFFLAGGDWKQIITMLVMSALVGVALIMITDTGQKRWAEYLTAWNTPAEAQHQLRESFQAIIRGGVFGVGLGNGQSKNINVLPLPFTDSIFAVIAEELGLLGVILLIALFLLFLWRGLVIARNAPDRFGKILTAGITCWIIIEAFMNMAVLVGLIPFTGNALPFISSGGSSMVTIMIGVGIILSVNQASNLPKPETERSTFGAVVDLRRRDGGRSVPRVNRSAGSQYFE